MFRVELKNLDTREIVAIKHFDDLLSALAFESDYNKDKDLGNPCTAVFVPFH